MGGDVRIALLLAALSVIILGLISPGGVIVAAIDGIDRLAWVIGLAVFGSIYAQSQVKLGTMDTVLNTFRAMFGRTPKGLVAAVILTLVLAGSLLGDAIAASAVIGVLVIMSLKELQLDGMRISAIIMMGAIIGSLMPPITQSVFLSSALIGLEDVQSALNIAYLTIGGAVILAIIWCSTFVKIKKLPEELIPERRTSQILKEEWKRLIPLLILVVMVVVRSLFDAAEIHIPLLTDIVLGIDSLFVAVFGGIPILGGIAFRVTQAIIIAIIASFFFTNVRTRTAETFKDGLKSVSKTAQIQICAGIMVGMFYAGGLIDRVVGLTEGLAAGAVTFGGGGALAILGMLTGSQTTAQNTLVPLLGPIFTETFDLSMTSAVIGASHIASGGQSMPPVCLTAFVIVGIVGGVISERVDPVKVMIYSLPVTIYLLLIGFLAWLGFIG